jgi:hypothetical protein
VARKLSAVSSTSTRYSPVIWATILLVDFERIQSRNPRVFLTPHTCTAVLFRLSDLGGSSSGASWRAIQWPGHLAERIGRLAPFCCFHRSSGNRHIARALSCGLVGGGGVSDQVSTSGGAHRGVLLPSGGLGGVLPYLEAPFLVGGNARVSTPALDTLTGFPATKPAYTAPTSA